MRSDKLSQFIIKLIKLTKSNELAWDSVTPRDPGLPNGEVILDKLYKTTVNDRDFRLYRYKYKYYHDEYDFEWSQRIRLELLDSDGNTDFEFEYQNSMNDLYDIVREQTSNVSDFIDSVLGLKLEILEAKYYTAKISKDVTEKVKNKVANNRLVIDATNQIDGDPDPGTVKKLKVTYSYSGDTLEKEVDEGQTLILP